MPLLNEVATGFERRFLYGYGRHFWNFLGVVGFGLMAGGGITAIHTYSTSVIKGMSAVGFGEYSRRVYCNEYSSYEEDYASNQDCWKYNMWIQNGSPKRDGYYTFNWQGKIVRHSYHADIIPIIRKMEVSYKSSIVMGDYSKYIFSLTLAGSGLGIISYVSVVSAILSIERNTRKD
tara:strand:+ start:650 stop:1177 length:528 start_codon:yes stop_codon:yes gene_type:complete